MEPVAPGKTRVGWIGTGVMGAAMAGHIREAGYELTVYNRTRAKAEPLLARGAVWAPTPREVARRSDVIFTMVGFPADLRQVVLETDGVIHGVTAGSVLVDMGTGEPALARELYETLQARGVASVDAPVSGGDIGARNASLSIMIGGDAEVVAGLMPLFQCMGKLIIHHGPAGAGQHAKMCNQVLIASSMISVCECLLYGYKAGLDLRKVIESVGSGAAGSWAINNLGPRILKRDFDPGFFVEHFLKDMGIALAEAGRMGIALPGLALAHQLYQSVKALGHGRSGTQALMLALERMSNVEMPAV
ncbi:MAG TPA: NAD(P)-dependent oxidoreductase [Phycisphaerae bacterium]|jgi:3-hydroxyisobutyrate dehydrogenase|nr:NAD(P)-dependent oxidoreductase [Phycisphaerae bacterium]HOB73925.1 NAD(P)-dependent oxidoreductase [Phycisphaerae bacterium]HOJ56277.1 NAD(P)-dependent oxidoreductase [Phycisphaerae bacterium]HOL28131.1 NAD(P)-dependent oxidoreductase [Phycisphaerae bacterium]HPP19758.1 NAD(P)-dependent oxidoreductase [Phycisphaerae bacterium]